MREIYRIYSKNSENVITNEISNINIEDRFINELCEMITEILEVTYNDRRIVKSLLKNGLKNKLDSNYKNEGLLQQYSAYILDKSSERIIKDLNLCDVEVNHNHALHAKFNDIIKKIKEKYN